MAIGRKITQDTCCLDGCSVEAPRLPDGLRVYAIGDIHGRADLLKQIFKLIDIDLEHFPPERCLHVFLGDYVDRGLASRQVIELLIDRSRLYDTVCLKGNHEDLLLNALERLQGFRDWRRLGALATLLSYGVAPESNVINEIDLIHSLRSAMPESHIRFLKGLKAYFTCGDYLFVHAGLRPGLPLGAQTDEDMMWIRDEFLESPANFEKYVIHGHTPVACPDIRSNRANIDTGAYATGNLTLLSIEADRMLVLT